MIILKLKYIMKIIVGAIVLKYHNNELYILFQKRSATLINGGILVLPGGSCEETDTILSGVYRELYEEATISAFHLEYIGQHIKKESHRIIYNMIFIYDGPITWTNHMQVHTKLKEVDDFCNTEKKYSINATMGHRWFKVSKLNEIFNLSEKHKLILDEILYYRKSWVISLNSPIVK